MPHSLRIENPYLQTPAESMRQLRTKVDAGLSEQEAQRRQKQSGKNIITDVRKRSALSIFIDQFRDPLVWVLLGAAILSFFLGEVADTIIIAVVIVINAALGFVQIWRTEKILEKIRASVRHSTLVMRDGAQRKILAEDLVVGDIVEIRAGEKIPADGRILQSVGFFVQEAALTGESEDVAKNTATLQKKTTLANRTNMVFMGTLAVSGSAQIVVTAIGNDTEYGKIAQILGSETSPTTPLQKKLNRTSVRIGWIIFSAILLLAFINLLQNQSILVILRTSIALAVAAIPEGMTLVLTITLSIGVARILRKKGAVRRLASGETLGAATVICTDKTGTLTQGKMKAIEIDFLQGMVLPSSEKPSNPKQELAVTALILASDAHRIAPNRQEYVGGATERTALAFAEEAGFNQQELRRKWKTKSEITFSSQWKYRAVLCDHPTQSYSMLFVVGAPDILLNRSSTSLSSDGETTPLTPEKKLRLEQRMEKRAHEGQRLLAITTKIITGSSEITHRDINNLNFLGVLCIRDPIRDEVKPAIKSAEQAGIKIKLVTGDHESTATAVARSVGLTVTDQGTCSGEELEKMSDQQLHERIEQLVVFSRVTPLDKQRIIRVLQDRGHVVAMTGDGVNDAVALKSADIGVAMGSGTDIAKDAATLVLLNDSFATIVAAIRQGRIVRDNIRKVISYLLATNAAEVAIFFASVVSGLPVPLIPAQILWVNMVTDSTSDIALALEPQESDVMARNPENPQGPLLGRALLWQIMFAGLAMTVACMGIYFYSFFYLEQDVRYARTLVFTFLAVASLLSVWSWRSVKDTIVRRGVWQNKSVIIATVISLGLHLAAIYVPIVQDFFETVALTLNDWLLVGVISLITVIVIDLRKKIIPYTYEDITRNGQTNLNRRTR